MKVVFHSFTISDVEDVDIYIAQPIWEWQQTEQGQWVMQNAADLRYYTSADPSTFGYRVDIRGQIADGPKLTAYLLKYGKF